MGKQKAAAAQLLVLDLVRSGSSNMATESDRRPSPPVLFDFGSFLFSINRPTGHEQQQW